MYNAFRCNCSVFTDDQIWTIHLDDVYARSEFDCDIISESLCDDECDDEMLLYFAGVDLDEPHPSVKFI